MELSTTEVMQREFLEYDLDDAIRILDKELGPLQKKICEKVVKCLMTEKEADDRLLVCRGELSWLKSYRQAVRTCRHYVLEDMQSQIDRSLYRLQNALSLN